MWVCGYESVCVFIDIKTHLQRNPTLFLGESRRVCSSRGQCYGGLSSMFSFPLQGRIFIEENMYATSLINAMLLLSPYSQEPPRTRCNKPSIQ